jgi:uridine kinase
MSAKAGAEGSSQKRGSAPLMVAVTGGSGSGKTTIARKLMELCPSIPTLLLQLDHYYKDLSHLSPSDRDLVNFDHPDALDFNLVCEQLQILSRWGTIERPHYDFKSHTRSAETVRVSAAPVILFDGILAMHDPSVRGLFDLTVYVDVPDDIRFIRRLRRDTSERGRTWESVTNQYLSSVKPMHDLFVQPVRPLADLVVSWERWNDRTLSMLAGLVTGMHERREAQLG